MTNGINTYSSTPASNIALFPEGQTPSSLNDGMRQVQADIRSWYEDAEWVNYGHVPTRATNTTFTIPTDVTATYTVNRRIKCTDSSTLYGTITASSYSAPNSTVTVVLDSGNLSASLTAISLALLKPTNVSLHANLGRQGADIASAATTDLSAATGDFVNITGTTTITALGTAASGIARTVKFTGALTLTHNATSLILPGAANITTAAGDVAIFRSLGSGNWVCVTYTKASGVAIVVNATYSKGSDIASATTTDIGAATGDFVDITGTTTITGLGTITAGIERTVRFTGALILTHNSVSLILPGAANITTASGDTAIFRSLGSGNWVCISYKKANGTAIVGVSGVAVQADMEAASSTTLAVTPGVIQHYRGVNKAWAIVTFSAGTPSLLDSWGVSSVTDSGTGVTDINFSTAFSSSNFSAVACLLGSNGFIHTRASATASSCRVNTSNTSGVAADINFQVCFQGDQ